MRMMFPSINVFISALKSRSDSLVTLADLSVERNDVGGVALARTKYFADAYVRIGQRRFLLSMPLSNEALDMARGASVRLKALRSQLLLEYRVLCDELKYIDSVGRMCSCDLLLEELPEGVTLADFLGSEPSEASCSELFAALNVMEQEFKRLGVINPNLTLENIIYGEDGVLYPIRLHYVTTSKGVVGDEFRCLRHQIGELLGQEVPCAEVSEGGDTLTPLNALYGYKSVGNPFEGLCVAESTAGYGYIASSSGEEVIAPQFIWAGDIHEGRAEVQTAGGMGLIDARGNYIIEPRYQIVEFDPRTGHTQARINEQWVTFDYNGRLLDSEDIESCQDARAALQDVELEA